MLDICLLGTGGMMPLPRRWLTSLMLRCQGSNLLIDCGEGTQIAIKEKGWSPNPIDIICITHFHADHISGLPGLLLSMGNAERTSPVTIIGPKGLEKIVKSLRVIAPELPFEIKYIEIDEAEGTLDISPYKINYFKLNHRILCFGYSVEIERLAKFDIEKAKRENVPLKLWNKLQHGETVVVDDIVYTPNSVMGEKRKGIKVTYCTDTRPVPSIEKFAKDADVFICEGMYGEKDKHENALHYKHMTMYEAAHIAKKVSPKELWLTHFSPSEIKPSIYKDEVRKIFKKTIIAKDGLSKEIKFDDE